MEPCDSDVEARDKSIVKLETKLRKVNQELQERGKLADSINIEELERRIHDLTNEKLQLQNGLLICITWPCL